ncbi:hypothetical protein LDENG_00267860 [Lucifuga dentata]|nr:hypothetical protein LDENG_00267860 [Lucifuga dentata]
MERDVTRWSSERLQQLLLGVWVEGSEGVCQLTDVSELEGEASINNRKGKLIFFYEWRLRAGWLGTSSGSVKYRGSLDVPNLSDKNDMDDLDISVSLCKDQPDTLLLQLMRRSGVQEVTHYRYLTEFSQGMILPTNNGVSKPQPAQKSQVQTSKIQISPTPRTSTHSSCCSHGSVGIQIPTCSFSLMETFLTSADELYRTFITQEVPDRQIEMRWRFRTWPNGL